jgi:hypothetical protein
MLTNPMRAIPRAGGIAVQDNSYFSTRDHVTSKKQIVGHNSILPKMTLLDEKISFSGETPQISK